MAPRRHARCGNDNEINPDVLGYIFEKYINQKQMGAYYTKEDITEYIGKNTILPFLLDSARNRCKSAFDGANSVWTHLQQEPDRYIYPAVRHGMSWDYQPGIQVSANLWKNLASSQPKSRRVSIPIAEPDRAPKSLEQARAAGVRAADRDLARNDCPPSAL